MGTRHAIAGSFAASAALAWIDGRLWRSQEKAASPTRIVDLAHASSRTQYVYFGGAFTQSSRHATTLLSRLEQDGSVLAPDSSFSRLNIEAEYDAVYSKLRLQSDRYDKLVVIGGSMGAINAFRLAGVFRRDVETSLIAIDPVLSQRGLTHDARLASKLTGGLRPGPVTNSLLAPLIPKLIQGQDADIYDKDVVGIEDYVQQSMAEIQSVTTAYFLDAGRTVYAAHLPDPGAYAGMKIVGLFSEFESTLDVAGKEADFAFATQQADAQTHVILGAHHLTFLEQPLVWLSAINRALALV